MFINQLSQAEIREQFTHYALFAGVVPCYFADEGAGCKLVTRNWVPEFTLSIATWLYGNLILMASLIDDDYEPAWPITLTRYIR